MQLFANNVETTLASDLTAGVTSMSVTSAAGMPEPGDNEYFLLTVCARSQNIESEFEIVKCTARAGTTLTIERAQEGTSDVAHDSGDIVSLRLTKGTLEDGFPPDLAIGRINNPLLHLPLKNSLDMVCGTGSVTFTRSTTATYIDRYGVVQDAAVNEARFEAEGLLIEGASTNKCLQSETFDNASWSKARCTISADATDAPDGTTTADGIIGDATTSTHYVRQQVSTSATTIALSCFCKKGDQDWVRLIAYYYDSSNNILGYGSNYYDLDSGVVGTADLSNVTSDVSIKTCSDGFYRCILVNTYTGGTAVAYVKVFLYAAEADTDATFLGDGSTINTYLWGAQLEEMPFATSYIPTTDAAVTRAKDVCSVTSFNNMSAANTEEMSVFADVRLLGHNSNHQYIYDVAGEATRSMRISNNNYMLAYYGVWCGGSFFPIQSLKRTAHVFNKTSAKIYVDGSLQATNTSSLTITGTLTSIKIGMDNRSSVNQLYGHISNFRIYSEALTEAEMRIA